jgi:hypothetical protein
VRETERGGLVAGNINVTTGYIGVATDNANVTAGHRVRVYIYQTVIAIIGPCPERPQQQKQNP